MTTESTTPQTEQLLSPEQVAELEARLKTWTAGSQFPATWNQLNALCRTLKAAWQDSGSWRRVAERLEEEKTALREQLAQVTNERDEARRWLDIT